MKGSGLMKNIVYRVSSRFFLTAPLTKKIEHRIRLLYPADRYSVIKRTENYLIKMYILAFAVVAGMLVFADFSLYYGCLVAVIVYVMILSRINTELSKQEVKLLLMFEEFISEVHFHYQFNGMLYEAIEKAIEKVPYDMSVHGQIILECLKKSSQGGSEDYRDISPNNLFLTFYSLGLTVLSYGDKETEEGTVFLDNLSYLKESVYLEVLKRNKLESQFTGLSAVTILPVFSIKIIERWAISNMPELRDAYEGITGVLSTIFLSLLTAGIYKIITILRNPYRSREYKSRWAEKLLEMDIVNYLILRLIRLRYKSSEKLNNLLKSVVYPYNIREFILRRLCFSSVAVIVGWIVGMSTGIGVLLSIVAAVLSGIVTYELFYVKIVLQRQLMIMDSEEEIVRYQSVILMLMHMDRITVEQILRQIRDFSVIFKDEIDEMIDGFSYAGMRVFSSIKEKTGFMPLEKLMDSFLAADMLGIERAFSGMEKDRNYYVEKHKQENEEIIEKKSVAAKAMSFIPLCLVILMKLILPFVLEGMKQLSNTGM
jgi:hypothetical protein